MCSARALPPLISHPLCQANQPKTSTNHIGKDTTVQAVQIRIPIPNHWMHTRQRLPLADKMLKLPIFPQAQIENASCKPMMQTFNKKLKKKEAQLDRRRRRAQHRQRMLANKIATYNQDDNANSSSSSSSSSTSE